MQRKCYIIVVTQELVVCLICPPSALRPAALRRRVYISGRPLVPVLQLLRGNLKKYKFKKFYQVFSIIASTCTGIQLIYKNLVGVQLCRWILRLLKALFFLYCNFQNCTAIVQLR